MHALTRFRNEKQFQAGVQLLKQMITAAQAGHFLADLADLMVRETLAAVTSEFEKTYGKIKNGRFAVIVLGKLGSREMTFSSDIDLVFVYDAPDMNANSGGLPTPERSSSSPMPSKGGFAQAGEKKLGVSVYYNRLSQRCVSALSAMGREGRLYEVDTRLRPSGGQGLLATSLQGLEQYFNESAWTFEYMAFTKARPVAGQDKLQKELSVFIVRQLTKPRDTEKLRRDVADMRERIAKEFSADYAWDIKYARGGLIDLDFIAQYLLLRHAPEHKDAESGGASKIFHWLRDKGCIETRDADALMEADRFLGQMFNMLRLCTGSRFDEATALPGLKKLLCQAAEVKDFPALKRRLIKVEQAVSESYNSFFQAQENL